MLNPPKKEDIPSWVNVPEKYFDLIKFSQYKFLPWLFFDREDLLFRLHGLESRYPSRILFPFARYDYSDDVACWEKSNPDKVIIIHDFASPGYEQRHEFSSFDEWYEYILSIVGTE